MIEYPRVSEETPCADCGFVGPHSDIACSSRVLTERMTELTAQTQRIADQLDALVAQLRINIALRAKRMDHEGVPR